MHCRTLLRGALGIAFISAVATAGGCGQTVAAAGGDTVQIALVEYRLNPDRVTARAGTVIVLVRNYGRLTHNLVISSDGHPDGAIRPLPPGGWGQATVALGPGTYQLSSTVQSDQALGLSGTLIVTR